MSILGTFRSRLRAVGWFTAAVLFTTGIVFWWGFDWTLEFTNTERFCIACHEMQDNVFKEYRATVHYANRSGVRAACPDCHVPRPLEHKIIRKIRASNEVLHKLLGTINTRDKFEDRRLMLAKLEWQRMKSTDSRECRNCHRFDYMDYAEQGRRAAAQHSKGFAEGKTCIECHRGIAHSLPPIEQDIGAPKLEQAALQQ